MPDKQSIRQLFSRYMQGIHSPADLEQLKEIIEEYSNDELADILEPLAASKSKDPAFNISDWENSLQYILQQKPAVRSLLTTNHLRIKRIAIAASILIAVATIAYFVIPKRSEGPTLASEKDRFKNDVTPGNQRAVLILADGREVILEGKGTQTLTDKNGALINNDNGRISYNNKNTKGTDVVYNTLRIPRKGEYQLLLSDGSTAKLNSESSIYYPTAFSGSERKVEVTGEVYFEIAKNANKPFIVSVKGTEIKVLGTHFNVNAYDDETIIKVTLLEGSVSVSAASSAVKIKPGQQAEVSNDIKIINGIDVEQVMAWKNGIFSFNRADIQTVMKQLSRWYDVEVAYEGPIPALQFGGKMGRDLNLSQVLRLLEKNEVHFRIEENAGGGKKIVVMK